MSSKKILIINQHGENRGDEAALRAMLRGLEREIGEKIEFDILFQFRDRSLHIELDQSIQFHHILISFLENFGLFLYALGKMIGIKISFFLGENTAKLIGAYEKACIVLSAPGGPYFGDIYAKHEPVHWFYVWLASLYKKSLFLYAPSAGPFQKPFYNWFRRRIYRRFDTICIRESQSVENLRTLLGKNCKIHLTADSAIQETIEPYDRLDYFSGDRIHLSDKFIVAVTGMQYNYPGDQDPAVQRARFNAVILTCMCHLQQKRDCHFIFLPQLYGKYHDDRSYHRLIGERLTPGTSWEIVPENFDSDKHRKVFGMADFCVASRYHPQIFSTSCSVPGVYFCYEHKQFSYLSAMGMEDFAFDIRSVDAHSMCQKIDEALNRYDTISMMLKKNFVALQKRSQKTTKLAAERFYRLSQEAPNH